MTMDEFEFVHTKKIRGKIGFIRSSLGPKQQPIPPRNFFVCATRCFHRRETLFGLI